MQFEEFKELCNRFKHTGETWDQAWRHIASVRAEGLAELNIQELIHYGKLHFCGNGSFPTGFILIEDGSPVSNPIYPINNISFVSLESVLSISFVPDSNCILDMEGVIDRYFPEATVDKYVAFTRPSYSIKSNSSGFATLGDIINTVQTIRHEPMSVVVKMYDSAADRAAGSLADNAIKLVSGTSIRLEKGTTKYLKAFCGRTATQTANADITIV